MAQADVEEEFESEFGVYEKFNVIDYCTIFTFLLKIQDEKSSISI